MPKESPNENSFTETRPRTGFGGRATSQIKRKRPGFSPHAITDKTAGFALSSHETRATKNRTDRWARDAMAMASHAGGTRYLAENRSLSLIGRIRALICTDE